jgi:hypothetical protein
MICRVHFGVVQERQHPRTLAAHSAEGEDEIPTGLRRATRLGTVGGIPHAVGRGTVGVDTDYTKTGHAAAIRNAESESVEAAAQTGSAARVLRHSWASSCGRLNVRSVDAACEALRVGCPRAIHTPAAAVDEAAAANAATGRRAEDTGLGRPWSSSETRGTVNAERSRSGRGWARGTASAKSAREAAEEEELLGGEAAAAGRGAATAKRRVRHC